MSEEKQRTLNQNNAMHLYFRRVADALNAAGYSVQEVLTNYKMDVEWTADGVKEIIWRTAQKRMLNKESTANLNKNEEVDLVYDVVNRFLGEKLKIESIPFPSLDSLENNNNN